MKRTRRNAPPYEKRGGFTLVEMVAASIILGMLLTVLITITRAGVRQAKRANDIRQAHPDTSILEDQLLRDLRNADGFASLPNGVTLFGAISTDVSSGRSTFQLVRVTYQVGDVNGLRTLVRTEQSPRGVSRRQVVWIGVGEFAVQPSGSASALQSDSQRTGGLNPMPSEITVALTANGRQVISRRIVHHREFR